MRIIIPKNRAPITIHYPLISNDVTVGNYLFKIIPDKDTKFIIFPTTSHEKEDFIRNYHLYPLFKNGYYLNNLDFEQYNTIFIYMFCSGKKDTFVSLKIYRNFNNNKNHSTILLDIDLNKILSTPKLNPDLLENRPKLPKNIILEICKIKMRNERKNDPEWDNYFIKTHCRCSEEKRREYLTGWVENIYGKHEFCSFCKCFVNYGIKCKFRCFICKKPEIHKILHAHRDHFLGGGSVDMRNTVNYDFPNADRTFYFENANEDLKTNVPQIAKYLSNHFPLCIDARPVFKTMRFDNKSRISPENLCLVRKNKIYNLVLLLTKKNIFIPTELLFSILEKINYY